jgi:hypothetical protein
MQKVPHGFEKTNEDDTELKSWGGERIQSLLVQWARRIVVLDNLT